MRLSTAPITAASHDEGPSSMLLEHN